MVSGGASYTPKINNGTVLGSPFLLKAGSFFFFFSIVVVVSRVLNNGGFLVRHLCFLFSSLNLSETHSVIAHTHNNNNEKKKKTRYCTELRGKRQYIELRSGLVEQLISSLLYAVWGERKKKKEKLVLPLTTSFEIAVVFVNTWGT